MLDAASNGLASGAPMLEIGAHGAPLHVAIPSRTATAAVVVLHEIYGMVPAIEAVTAKLAAQGYLCVAPELYHRCAQTSALSAAATRPLESSLTAATLQEDLADTLDCLADRDIPAASVGLLGFSMGGTIALWAASRIPVGAAVTFYGGGIDTPRWPDVEAGLLSAPRLRAPWFGVYGDRDRSIPVAAVERLRAAAEGAPVVTAISRYPQAGHAFATDPASRSYRSDAARDAWARALGWFDAHLR